MANAVLPLGCESWTRFRKLLLLILWHLFSPPLPRTEHLLCARISILQSQIESVVVRDLILPIRQVRKLSRCSLLSWGTSGGPDCLPGATSQLEWLDYELRGGILDWELGNLSEILRCGHRFLNLLESFLKILMLGLCPHQ